METTNRLYRADRPDRFKHFMTRSERSGRSSRSYGNQALRRDFVENIVNKKSHELLVHFVIYGHS